MVERAFGEAGATVVVEDCLGGEEVSAFALADGERVLMLETARITSAPARATAAPIPAAWAATRPRLR